MDVGDVFVGAEGAFGDSVGVDAEFSLVVLPSFEGGSC